LAVLAVSPASRLPQGWHFTDLYLCPDILNGDYVLVAIASGVIVNVLSGY